MAEHRINDQELINLLVELIQANLANENFGARELAEAAGMRQRKLSIKLRNIKNKSVSRFICETRLQKALEMLQNEDFTASEVAYKVGFASATYFNKCFHEFFGYPPGKIRKGDFDNLKAINPGKKISDYLPESFLLRSAIYVFGGLILLTGLFFIISSVFSKSYFSNNSPAESGNHERSLAVLPFINLSDSTTNQYFIDGLMEEILTDLSRIGDLRITSRTSVEQFRESNKTASEIAKKLNVEYLVTGSGQKYADSYELRVQLIDAKNDKQLWAESFDKEIKTTRDIYETQSQIAQLIAAKLKATITPEEKKLIENDRTKSLTAYYYYLRGNEELSQSWYPDYKPENLKRAFMLYRKALENDSTFSKAYNGQALVYWQKFARDQTISDYNTIINYADSALILADIALSYDPYLAISYCIRASHYAFNGNIKKALEENDKALRCNSNDWFATYQKGQFYSHSDVVKSIELFHKAANLANGPELPQTLYQIGNMYFQTGFSEMANYYYLEAFKLEGDSAKYSYFSFVSEACRGDFRKSIERREKKYLKYYPDEPVLSNLGTCYLFLGQDKEALKYFKKYISENKMSELFYQPLYPYIGFAYWQNGYKQLANYYFKRTIERCNSQIKSSLPEDNYFLAAVFAFLGDKGKAYENLMIFNQKESFSIADLTFLKTDPLFGSIRNEFRFRNIVRNVEAKYQAEHERVRKWLEEQGNL